MKLEDYVDAYAWSVVTILWSGAYLDTGKPFLVVCAGCSGIVAIVNLRRHWGDK
jgi:hypothetical protein